MAGTRTDHVRSEDEPDGEDTTLYLRLAMDRTDRAIVITDTSGRVRHINPAFTRLFGYGLEHMDGQNPWGLLAGPMTDQHLHFGTQGNGQGSAFHDDLLLRTRSGEPVWVSARIEPVYDAEGRLEHIVGLLGDVTRSKRLQVLQREVLEAIAADTALHDVMAMICTQVEAMAPEVVCSVLAVDDAGKLRSLAAPSMPASIARGIDGVSIGPDAGSCGTAIWRGKPVTVTDIATDPLWRDCKEPMLDLGFKACWSSPLQLRNGKIAGSFAFYYRTERGPDAWHHEIVEACKHFCIMAIERHQARARIDTLSYYDAVTGLPNLALMRDRLARTLAADPDRRQTHALLCLDVDHFKDINDSFGHGVGDAVLAAVGERLLRGARSADMVSRLSGDAFMVILANTDADTAAKTAQKIMDSLLEPVTVSGVSLSIPVSIGIAVYPEDGTDVDMLHKNCDTAMFGAKDAGRGTYKFFSTSMNAVNQDRLVLGTALRQALIANTLEMAFQPQIDRAEGRLHGVEALARWTHPTLGSIGPDRFIPIAEQIGMIDRLGAWAVNAACRQLSDWRRDGYRVPSISVNASPLQFRDPEFCEIVHQCVHSHGLDPSDLTIEITEGVMIDETPAVLSNIGRLTRMGVRLSMDDFGTGHSSLSLLARLPVSELKIDRGFMTRLEDDANAQAVVTAVVSIGRSLGMTVVAEGVETEAQGRFLQTMGCAVHQGYHYARPIERERFSRWLADFFTPDPMRRPA